MVRSDLLQKMCDLYPNILRKDLEKIIEQEQVCQEKLSLVKNGLL